ncbi:hypothetical protein T439DRAFT_136899 [Meredithblackwellia eburnea MCA 4105]
MAAEAVQTRRQTRASSREPSVQPPDINLAASVTSPRASRSRATSPLPASAAGQSSTTSRSASRANTPSTRLTRSRSRGLSAGPPDVIPEKSANEVTDSADPAVAGQVSVSNGGGVGTRKGRGKAPRTSTVNEEGNGEEDAEDEEMDGGEEDQPEIHVIKEEEQEESAGLDEEPTTLANDADTPQINGKSTKEDDANGPILDESAQEPVQTVDQTSAIVPQPTTEVDITDSAEAETQPISASTESPPPLPQTNPPSASIPADPARDVPTTANSHDESVEVAELPTTNGELETSNPSENTAKETLSPASLSAENKIAKGDIEPPENSDVPTEIKGGEPLDEARVNESAAIEENLGEEDEGARGGVEVEVEAEKGQEKEEEGTKDEQIIADEKGADEDGTSSSAGSLFAGDDETDDKEEEEKAELAPEPELTVEDELDMAIPHELEDIMEEPEEEVLPASTENPRSEPPPKDEGLDSANSGGATATEAAAKISDSGDKTSSTPSLSSIPSNALSATANSQSSLAKRSPPIPGTLTMPPGLQSMTQRDVQRRFNGYKIVAVLALNVDLIKIACEMQGKSPMNVEEFEQLNLRLKANLDYLEAMSELFSSNDKTRPAPPAPILDAPNTSTLGPRLAQSYAQLKSYFVAAEKFEQQSKPGPVLTPAQPPVSFPDTTPSTVAPSAPPTVTPVEVSQPTQPLGAPMVPPPVETLMPPPAQPNISIPSVPSQVEAAKPSPFNTGQPVGHNRVPSQPTNGIAPSPIPPTSPGKRKRGDEPFVANTNIPVPDLKKARIEESKPFETQGPRPFNTTPPAESPSPALSYPTPSSINQNMSPYIAHAPNPAMQNNSRSSTPANGPPGRPRSSLSQHHPDSQAHSPYAAQEQMLARMPPPQYQQPPPPPQHQPVNFAQIAQEARAATEQFNSIQQIVHGPTFRQLPPALQNQMRSQMAALYQSMQAAQSRMHQAHAAAQAQAQHPPPQMMGPNPGQPMGVAGQMQHQMPPQNRNMPYGQSPQFPHAQIRQQLPGGYGVPNPPQQSYGGNVPGSHMQGGGETSSAAYFQEQ